MTDQDAKSEPTKLYESPGVLGLLVALAAVAAFAGAIDGELVWDDAAVLGRVAQYKSWTEAFSGDLFGSFGEDGLHRGASYWRPLVMLTFLVEMKLAAAPEFLMHATNLLLHAAAAVFVYRALLRWCGASGAFACQACGLGAALWAVMPLKAENVAWISGRADLLGVVLLLAAIELSQRSERWGAVSGALGTACVLLVKEAMVVAPLLFVIDEVSRGKTLRRSVLSSKSLASAAMVAAYLVLRSLLLRIHGGNEALFAAMTLWDRVLLVLETLGEAAVALVLPFRAHVLKGPYGVHAGHLNHEPLKALLGAAFVAGGALLAWRVKHARLPLALVASALLPVSNLIPNALESRFSDRFLYLPTLGVGLGVALLVLRLGSGLTRRIAVGGVAVASLVLGVCSFNRSTLFRRGKDLWSWEIEHGSRAPSVYVNAAYVAEKAEQVASARSLYLQAEARYQELGFDNSTQLVLRAARLQLVLRGELDRAFVDQYLRALEALSRGQAAQIELEFVGLGTRAIDTSSQASRAFAQAHGKALQREWLLIRVRRGERQLLVQLDALSDACVGCLTAAIDAARGHLAVADPQGALARLGHLAPGLPLVESLTRTAKLQARVLSGQRRCERSSRADALLLGEAYGSACRALDRSSSLADKCWDGARVGCALVSEPVVAVSALPMMRSRGEGQPEGLERWNVDPEARGALVAEIHGLEGW